MTGHSNGNELRLAAAATAAFVLGNSAQGSAPLLVDALVSSYGWSESKAGLAVSIEFAGIAVTSVLVAPYVLRFRKWKLALIGCLVVMGMQIACMANRTPSLIFSARFISGFAAGVILAIGTAVASTARRPARTFSIMNAGAALALGSLIAAGGLALDRWGVRGVLGSVGVMFAVLLGVVVLIPERSPTSGPDKLAVTNALPNRLAGCLLVMGFIVFNASSGLCFTFAIDFGHKAGLTLAQASSMFGGSFLVGFGASVVSGWMDTRFGLAKPLTLSIVIVGMTWFLICTYPIGWVFVGSITVNTAAYFFAIPYLLSTAATLDREGRWTAIASTAMSGAMAIAPVLGGWILESRGSTTLGSVSFGGALIGLILLTPALLRHRRSATADRFKKRYRELDGIVP